MGFEWDFSNGKICVIAEIGKNFIQKKEELSVDEYLSNAKKLVKSAKHAGANAVKFQTHNVEDEQLNIELISPHFLDDDRYSWVKRNTESTPFNEFWIPLKNYCDKQKITFFSTPMSRGAAVILNKLKVKLWKVGSADILDFLMLDYLANTEKPIIISSGMTTIDELDKVVGFLKDRDVEFAILHCVSAYPCTPENLNISTITSLKERYNVPIGFSDHSLINESSLIACQIGAKIIEKHFTFSREFWGPDHKASITPHEFKNLVKEIRHFEDNKDDFEIQKSEKWLKCLKGDGSKSLQKTESVFRPVFRKCLVAGTEIGKKTTIDSSKIYAMRPQEFCNGLPSEDYESVIGKKTIKTLKKYEPITRDILK